MKDFKNIGIVGAGSMGIGIAQIASTSGCKVFLYDQNVEIAQSALNKLKKIFYLNLFLYLKIFFHNLKLLCHRFF